MPRRAAVIALLALVSLGLFSVYPAFSQTDKESAALREEMAELRTNIATSRERLDTLLKLTEKASERASREAQWAKEYTNTGFIVISLIIGVGAILAAFFTIFYRGALRRVAQRAEAQTLKKIDDAREQAGRFSEFIIVAFQYINEGENNLTIASCDSALSIDHRSAIAWNLKGLALLRLRNFQEGLRAIENAIKISPDYGVARYNKACAHALMNQKGDMLDALTKSIKLHPKFKEQAKTDPAFRVFQDDDPEFRALVYGEEQ